MAGTNMNCTHDDYSPGITFDELHDAHKFAPNKELDGVHCQLCDFAFYDEKDGEDETNGKDETDGKDEENGTTRKEVSSKDPAFICKNHAKGCKHVICYSCHQIGIQAQFKCTHEDYSAGISYEDLGDERWFKPYMKYDGRNCQLCSVIFYPTKKVRIYKKVDSKNPSYVCKNHAKGCNHLVCNLCKLKKHRAMELLTGGGRGGRGLRSSGLTHAK
jgi:hypothetical protein